MKILMADVNSIGSHIRLIMMLYIITHNGMDILRSNNISVAYSADGVRSWELV